MQIGTGARHPHGAGGMAWTADQLAHLSGQPPSTPWRANPRPPGVIRPGSASEAVLAFLADQTGQSFTRWELIAATGRSRKAVDAALDFLGRAGMIVRHEDCTPMRFATASSLATTTH